MVSDTFDGSCDIFLCYRNSGSETAKQFKKSLSKIRNKYFGYVWYSDQESIGNYERDISALISSAKYAILFITRDFTDGFLTSDEKNNYENCVTVQEIVEIEKRRQAGQIIVIAIHIDGYVFNYDDLKKLEKVFENAQINTLDTASAYKSLNTNPYYRRKTDIDEFAEKLSKNILIERFVLETYYNTIRQSINWLIGLPVQWGPNDQSNVQQNANTCEGLLALKIAKYDSKKKSIYQRALKSVLDNISDYGLQSKTLKAETVICTSLGLFLLSLEKRHPIGNEIKTYCERINTVARNLWDIRNEELGWGFYCERTSNRSCNLFTTAWALLALNQYDFISNTESFENFCLQIFEFETDGAFGYFEGDDPKVISTAMYLILFYQLPQSLQEKIKSYYNYRQAIQFVHMGLTQKNIQVEVMVDDEEDELKIKRAPWYHITIGAALSALSLAKRQNDLSKKEWMDLLNYLDNLINDCVDKVAYGKVCYNPPMLIANRGKRFTFPTAYMIWGLQMVENTNSIMKEDLKTLAKVPIGQI